MPYIQPKDRKVLRRGVRALLQGVQMLLDDGRSPGGILCYIDSVLTDHVLRVMPKTDYRLLSELYGAKVLNAHEFWHKIVRPYEDKKEQQNGSVWSVAGAGDHAKR
jgi:hypothetical protein